MPRAARDSPARMEKFGNGQRDWLSGVPFVVDEAGARVDFEAVPLLVRGLLEIDTNMQKAEIASDAPASVGDCQGQIGRFHLHRQALAVGISIVDCL